MYINKVRANSTIFLLLALSLHVFGTWFLNYFVYPDISNVYSFARDISSIASCITFLMISIVAYKKQLKFDIKLFAALSIILISAGACCVTVGLHLESSSLIILGTVLRGIAISFITIFLGLALASLEYRQCLFVLTLGFGLSYFLRMVYTVIPISSSPLMLILSSGFTLLVTYPLVNQLNLKLDTSSVEEMSITQPDSFIPFTHKIFIAIFAFSISFGFALSFASLRDSPVQSINIYTPLLFVLIFLLLKRNAKEDSLYTLATLTIVAGYLCALVFLNFESQYLSIANGLLLVGSEIFEILVWLILSRICHRNLKNSILVLSWGRLANASGILIGANIGHLINYFGQVKIASMIIALMLFAFISVIIIFIKDFNFAHIVQGIKDVEDIQELLLENFDNKITEIEKLYSLTPRESEVYSLLVKGRNAGYVNEELSISINTVKTHVSNIYKKLGVHSQQELIDQFEELETF